MNKHKLLLAFPNVNRKDIFQTYTGTIAKNIYDFVKDHEAFDVTLDTVILSTTNKRTDDFPIEDLKKYAENDIILFAGLKFLDRGYKVVELAKKLKQLNPKILLCQLSDQAVPRNSVADLTFCTKLKDGAGPKNIGMGWTANAELFKSTKTNDKTLRVFVDHPSYVDSYYTHDKTEYITNELSKLDYKKYGYENFEFFRIGNSEMITNFDTPITKHDRQGVKHDDYVKTMNCADIFFVTHPESVGLSALEAAMSGALVVLPEGYMEYELLNSINFVEFGRKINWDLIFSKIDQNKSREMAEKFNYSEYITKMVNIILGRVKST